MRESGVPMMHSMIRLVEKGESNKSPEPPVRNNAPSGTVYRRASKPQTLMYLPRLCMLAAKNAGAR